MTNSVLHAMTVDVEDWFQVSAFDGVLDRARWDGYERRVDRNVAALLDAFGRARVRATFFVLGWVAERHPAMVRALVAAGHEVASHGYEHRLVDRMTAEEFRADLARAAAAIEAAGGGRVRGFRAPSFSFSARSPWAHGVLREEGYEFSSSVFPVRHDRYGVPDFPRQPVRLEGADGRGIWEFPMTTWRVLGRNVPAAGGGWLRALPLSVTRRALRSAEADGRPGVVYVHPWEVDPGQPRVPAAPLLSRFRHSLNLSRTLPRLERLLAEFPFSTMSASLAAFAAGTDQPAKCFPRTESGTKSTLPTVGVNAQPARRLLK